MNPALFYLIGRTTLGGLKQRLGRLKQPKYLFPALFGTLYMCFAAMPAFFGMGDAPAGRLTAVFTIMGTVLLCLATCFAWVFDPLKGGFNFSETEAELLLAAPLSRRDLIHYYVLRAQPGVLFSSLVFMIIFPLFTRAPSALNMGLTFFFAINLARLFALTVAMLWGTLAGRWYHWPLRILPPLLLILGALVSLAGITHPDLPYLDVTLWNITVPGEYALVTTGFFRAVAESAFQNTLLGALPGWGVALALTTACYLVLTHLNVSFEDNTLALAKRRLEVVNRHLRHRRISKPHKERDKTWPPLAPVGPPWGAFVWKNFLWTLRARSFRNIAGVLLIGVLIWVGIMLFGDKELQHVYAMMLVPFCLVTTFTLPAMLRTDFRSELEHLEIIKTLPISPRQLFFALMLVTVGMTLFFQLTLAGMILVSLASTTELSMELWVSGLCTLFALPTLSATTVILENCLMLWLPAWFVMKTPQMGKGGIEMIGRGMISILARLFVLSVLCLIPGLVGFAVAVFGGLLMGLWALPPAVAVGSLLLLGEMVLIAGNVAQRYNRLEPGGFEI